MSDLLTPTDPLDAAIRAAVRDVVGTAPVPLPYEQLDRPDLVTAGAAPGGGRGRRWLAVAAALIVAAGIAGVAVAVQRRGNTAQVVPATNPTTPETAVAPPPDAAPTTNPATAPTPRPPLHDPSGFTTGPFPDVAAGSIAAGPGSLAAITTDGDVWLYPEALGPKPGEPVELLPGYAPNPTQVFSPLTLIGPVNGSLITTLMSGEQQESGRPVVNTLSQPMEEPAPLFGGGLHSVSHDGTRFAGFEDEGARNDFVVYDLASGTVSRRGSAAFGARFDTVAWSADDRELYLFTPDYSTDQSKLVRVDSTSLKVIDTIVLEEWDVPLGRSPEPTFAFFVGEWDGHLVFSGHDGQLTALSAPDFAEVELDIPPLVPDASNGLAWYDLADDGRTVAWTTQDGTAHVQRVGEQPQVWREGIAQVAFVENLTAEPTSPPRTQPPTTVPDVPAGVFPEPNAPRVDTFTAIAPSGSIDAAPGDMVTRSVDGDLHLHPGAFDPTTYGRSPGAPLRLVDGGDPRAEPEEGPGPNVIGWVGGFMNGALVYGDCCEPVAGNVLTVSEPDGPPTNLGFGWSGAADSTGRRWATANDYGLSLLDYPTGRGYSREINNSDSEYLNVSEVIWSPDETELWVLGWGVSGSTLIRYAADPSLALLGATQLGENETWFTSVGRLPDSTVVVAGHAAVGDTRTTGLRTLTPAGELGDQLDTWALPNAAQSVHLSPDGTTLAYVVDDIAYLLRADQEPVEWGTGVSSLWFVTTPAMPIGQPCDVGGPDAPQLLDPAVFADLDADGLSERITAHSDVPLVWFGTCGTPLEMAELELMRSSGWPHVFPVDVRGDGQTELWIGSNDGGSVGAPPDVEQCVTLYQLVRGALYPLTERHCIGTTGGMACVDIDGTPNIVFYDIALHGGNDVWSATSADITARLVDGPVLGTRTYEGADVQAAVAPLLDLAC